MLNKLSTIKSSIEILNQFEYLNRVLNDYNVSQISQLQNTISEISNNFVFSVNEIINPLNSQVLESIVSLTDNLTRLNKINLNNQIVFPYDNINETVNMVSDYIDDLRDISSDSTCEIDEIESLSSIVSNIPRSSTASMDINTIISIISLIIAIITFIQTTFDDSSKKQLEVLNKINSNIEFILENYISD